MCIRDRCGIIGGTKNEKLVLGQKSYKNDLYLDFVDENPDFAPKAKMTVSRTKFNKWLLAYSEYEYGCLPEEGRDGPGKWLRFRNKQSLEKQADFEF